MILEGYVKDRNGVPLENASVELKDNTFVTVYNAKCNSKGYYRFDIPENQYPFLTAVKDYAVNYLEYWCQNIPLYQNMSIDITVDTLEIYGLHVFSVKGARNGLMAYFRPMSLAKYCNGEQDIAPDGITVKVAIDGKTCSVVALNKVKECVAEREMTAYLIQVETHKKKAIWSRFDIEITDADCNCGAATIFNS